MVDIFVTNTLTHSKEKFVPVKENEIGVYSCGPTVYWNQHIGHMYAYVNWDLLVRFLRFLGYGVKWVMNITDVGHMTSDEDTGEDKMEKGAEREKISVWEVADKYIIQFRDSMHKLGINPPDVFCRATEHIQEQIDLIKLIEKKGFAYKTKTGLVFDTGKFSHYADFANLNLAKQEAGARVEVDLEKKNPWDFLLWVTNQPKHIMQWDSPWGVGFPGWHIECTAMSVKYLGEKFDIHTGGIEHIGVHHTNEIAQGYGAFGHGTANYWLHNAWLTLKSGEKMSKSKGNFITVQDLEKKGYDLLALRYLFLNSHYKRGTQFSFLTLDGAVKALRSLRALVISLKSSRRTTVSPEKLKKADKYREEFLEALADDLNVPQALSILWEMLKSNLPPEDKYDLALLFDEILGLDLKKVESKPTVVPDEVKELKIKREKYRKEGNYKMADKIRKQIAKLGYLVDDTSNGPVVKLQKQSG